MKRPFIRGITPFRGLTITMVINHLHPLATDPPSIGGPWNVCFSGGIQLQQPPFTVKALERHLSAEFSFSPQGGPLLVINGVIIPINGLINR